MSDFEAPQAPITEQEFKLTGADFERVRQLIYKHAGISLHAGKQAMVYSRLSRRLRETRFGNFGDYLSWLERTTGAEAQREWQTCAPVPRGPSASGATPHPPARNPTRWP
jgi:chemotaxis protein methyltransferase CheR